MQLLLDYFPGLSERQQDQFAQLEPLYREWNQRINVISRKDIDHLYEHHVLHSLAIAKVVRFLPGARVLDLGTGGGFPGIPLAILFPETHFTLVDSIGKKINVVKAVAEGAGIRNVEARHQRVEDMKRERFDFVVSRAVARLAQLVPWSFRLIKNEQLHALPNGLIALKGGQVKEEIAELEKGAYTETYPIQEYFPSAYFAEKYMVYVQY